MIFLFCQSSIFRRQPFSLFVERVGGCLTTIPPVNTLFIVISVYEQVMSHISLFKEVWDRGCCASVEETVVNVRLGNVCNSPLLFFSCFDCFCFYWLLSRLGFSFYGLLFAIFSSLLLCSFYTPASPSVLVSLSPLVSLVPRIIKRLFCIFLPASLPPSVLSSSSSPLHSHFLLPSSPSGCAHCGQIVDLHRCPSCVFILCRSLWL